MTVHELTNAIDQICTKLDQMLADEKKFSVDMQLALEQANWEMMRQANELRELAYYFGG